MLDLAQYPALWAENPHFSRSNKFQHFRTIDVIDVVRDAGLVPTSVVMAETRLEHKRGFQKHLVRFARRTDLEARLPEYPEVIIDNAHDGTGAFHARVGFFRTFCFNGLYVGTSFGSYRVSHMGAHALDAVFADVQSVVARFENVQDRVESWKQMQLETPQQLALAARMHRARWPLTLDEDGCPVDAAPVHPFNLLRTRRTADEASDFWTVFNRVQENAVQGQVATRAGGRGRKIKAIDALAKVNSALWDEAEKYHLELTAA